MPKIEIGVRPCAGIAPRAGMNTDWPHERAEPQLTFCHGPSRVGLSLSGDREAAPEGISRSSEDFCNSGMARGRLFRGVRLILDSGAVSPGRTAASFHCARSKRKLRTLSVLSQAPVILPCASRVNRIRLPLPLKRSAATGSNGMSFDFNE